MPQTPRRFPRYTVERPLKIIVFWEDMPLRTVHGHCHTLGEGGLGATVADDLYLGDVVSLEMPPLTRTYVRVRNIRGIQKGFEFLQLSTTQRQAVHRLCELSNRPADVRF